MKAGIEVELEPFGVPNFVLETKRPLEQQGRERLSIPLSALDSYTLDRLCDEFRDAVFKKAGKDQPPRSG